MKACFGQNIWNKKIEPPSKNKIYLPMKGESSGEESSPHVDMVDVEQEEAEVRKAKLRKQAGVPELAADGLASACAVKTMFFNRNFRSTC